MIAVTRHFTEDDFMDRPDNRDSDRIEQAIHDAEQSRSDDPAEVLARYANPEAVVYAATVRAEKVGADLRPDLRCAATWIDGFMAGARYQQLRIRDES